MVRDPQELAFRLYNRARRTPAASGVREHIVIAHTARRRGLPIVVDAMSEPYSGSPLCVAVKRKRLVRFASGYQLSAPSYPLFYHLGCRVTCSTARHRSPLGSICLVRPTTTAIGK